MKNAVLLAAAASAMMVAGCNRAATNNSANVSAANATANAAGATAATGAAVDAAFLQGHWGQGGCDQTVTFNADGSAVATNQTEPGRWTLAGNALTLVGESGSQPPTTMTVAKQGDALAMTNPAGQTAVFTRCPAAAAGTAAAPAGNAADADEGEE